MGTKADCTHDICRCPCHQGRKIDTHGKIHINHEEADCDCVECDECRLRIKKDMKMSHDDHCPENRQNVAEEDKDKTKIARNPPKSENARRRQTDVWRKHSPREDVP